MPEVHGPVLIADAPDLKRRCCWVGSGGRPGGSPPCAGVGGGCGGGARPKTRGHVGTCSGGGCTRVLGLEGGWRDRGVCAEVRLRKWRLEPWGEGGHQAQGKQGAPERAPCWWALGGDTRPTHGLTLSLWEGSVPSEQRGCWSLSKITSWVLTSFPTGRGARRLCPPSLGTEEGVLGS